jgi:hypothetical protein
MSLKTKSEKWSCQFTGAGGIGASGPLGAEVRVQNGSSVRVKIRGFFRVESPSFKSNYFESVVLISNQNSVLYESHVQASQQLNAGQSNLLLLYFTTIDTDRIAFHATFPAVTLLDGVQVYGQGDFEILEAV